jgi:exonuclease-1
MYVCDRRCVFAGCDFLPVEATIKGFGIMSAYTMIKKYRNLERVLYLLQRDKKKKVPEGFASSFWKAIQTFKYARGSSPPPSTSPRTAHR